MRPDTSLVRTPSQILLAGLALGLCGDYLLWHGLTGPGFAVWLVLLAGSALWLARTAGAARVQTLAVWSGVALSAALLMVLRDLPVLIPALWLVLIGAATLVLLQCSGILLRAARIADHLYALCRLPLQAVSGAPRLFIRIDMGSVVHDPRVPGLIRGVILALPLLFVFTALFSAADATFSRYTLQLTTLFSPETPKHVLLVLVYGWLAAGLLMLVCRTPQATSPAVRSKLQLGVEETTVLMSLLSALFVVFVLLQMSYLFGGAQTIRNTSGLTLAEYARRGFFELLVVAGLTLTLLLVLGATSGGQRMFRILGGVLVFCVLLILVSATQRLLLYTDSFGLTIDRFNALAVMLWQAFNLLSFAATVLRGRIEGFASGLAISGIASVLLLALANPAAIVARVNIDRALKEHSQLDVPYLLRLGSDAVPVVLENFEALSPGAQCEAALQLLDRYPVDAESKWLKLDDWRSWNASRAAAQRAVAARGGELQALADAAYARLNESIARSVGQPPFVPVRMC